MGEMGEMAAWLSTAAQPQRNPRNVPQQLKFIKNASAKDPNAGSVKFERAQHTARKTRQLIQTVMRPSIHFRIASDST